MGNGLCRHQLLKTSSNRRSSFDRRFKKKYLKKYICNIFTLKLQIKKKIVKFKSQNLLSDPGSSPVLLCIYKIFENSFNTKKVLECLLCFKDVDEERKVG